MRGAACAHTPAESCRFAGHRRSCGLKGSELSSTAEGALQLQRARKDLIAAAQSKHPLIRFVAKRELNGDCVR